MARQLPDAARQAVEAEATATALITFMEITHAGLSDPIRVVSDVFDYTWGGHTWTGIPFDVQPVTDEDRPPFTEVVVPNIDRRIGRALIDATGRARVALTVLSSADFSLADVPRQPIGTPEVIYSFAHFELVEVQADVAQLSGRLTLRDYAREPWPYLRATQARAPGLYW